jgi:hypothetical protein
MAVRNCWDDVMLLPCMGAGAFQNSQSPGRCRSRPVMPTRLTRPRCPRLVNFAHSREINELMRLPNSEAAASRRSPGRSSRPNAG